MEVEKKDLPKSQVELNIELSLDEFKPYISQGAEKVSREIKIEGFRPGKVPYNVLKQKIGEMTILEEAAHIAINKTMEEAIKDEHAAEEMKQLYAELKEERNEEEKMPKETRKAPSA